MVNFTNKIIAIREFLFKFAWAHIVFHVKLSNKALKRQDAPQLCLRQQRVRHIQDKSKYPLRNS
jgi:hypothetical protein